MEKKKLEQNAHHDKNLIDIHIMKYILKEFKHSYDRENTYITNLASHKKIGI